MRRKSLRQASALCFFASRYAVPVRAVHATHERCQTQIANSTEPRCVLFLALNNTYTFREITSMCVNGMHSATLRTLTEYPLHMYLFQVVRSLLPSSSSSVARTKPREESFNLAFRPPQTGPAKGGGGGGGDHGMEGGTDLPRHFYSWEPFMMVHPAGRPVNQSNVLFQTLNRD